MSERITIVNTGRSFEEVGLLRKEIETLQKENATLRECVEFYADADNWEWDGDEYNSIKKDNAPDKNLVFCGGHKARETLKELEGGE